MIELLDSEFDLEKSIKFDNANYNYFYSSLDPCKLFIDNGRKVAKMGEECQNDMMNLVEVLVNMQDTCHPEINDILFEIFHIFSSLDIKKIDKTTYDIYFKKYVDKYVMINKED